jgi:hypothetical protein
MPEVSPTDSLRSFEAQYFADYCSFSGKIRAYVAAALREAFRRDPGTRRRRFHLLSLIAQEYAGYEDAAAMLKAFLDYRTGKVEFPLVALMNYRPGEAHLDAVFREHGIKEEDELLAKLQAREWVPASWPAWFPEIDIERCLRFACRALVSDLRFNQKKLGIAAYNKIKHGLIVVPSGRKYSKEMPDSPATIYSSKKFVEASDTPFIIYGFPMEDSKITERERLIHYTQLILQMLAALYLSASYPGEVKKVWGGTAAMFRSDDFTELLDLMRQVTVRDQGLPS